MTASDRMRMRQLTSRAEAPEPNPRGLESVQAACLAFLRKRGLTHGMTSSYGAMPPKRTEDNWTQAT